MFGFIYAFFQLITSIAASIRDASLEADSKLRTFNEKTGTYLNYNGVEKNALGEYCHTTRDAYGDIIQYNKYGQVIRNLSQEERNRHKHVDDTVVQIDRANMHTGLYSDIYGIRYRDKENYSTYVIRSIEKNLYYMDYKSGMLVRPTDGQVRHDKLRNEFELDISDHNEIINRFNQSQLESKNKHVKCIYYYNNEDCRDKSDNFLDMMRQKYQSECNNG